MQVRQAAFLLLLGSIACARPGADMSAEHAAAIGDSARAFLAEFTRLSEDARWDSVAALYSQRADFRFLENGAVRYADAEAIRTALAMLPVGTRIRTEYSDVIVQPLGPGVAGVAAQFATQFVDSTGVTFGFSGAISMTLQHEPAGWRIVAGHSSAPVPRGP
jgi:hypothetical protein